ncbi:N-alpha-acetyltransferase 30-like [Hoplias malabaricus]|uniref:N-alpha-acetyltransferase 30-like n=1 Tax=Hoplias malabaricus TaxID=27720 RepID=UPI003462C1CE
MAAVPSGPSGALPSSPAQICLFPGDRCAMPADDDEEEALNWRLEDVVISDPGHDREVGEIENKQKSLFTDVHPHCHGSERQVNGLNCIGLPGFPRDSEPSAEESDLGTKLRAVGVQKRNDHRICQVTHHDMNKKGDSGIRDGLNVNITSSRTESRPNHCSDVCGKECGLTAGFPSRPAEVSEFIFHSEADGALEHISSLDLNSKHSHPRPAGRSQEITYVRYESELQMPGIMRLITKDLSEPYSIYTYRYFIHNWPQLCFLAMVEEECVGAIVCKLDMHKKMFRRGYIAMLAVDSKHRRKSIGTNLVKKAIYAMVEGDCDEVVLETEITNKSALKLYENLGFVRDKRLFRYYLNGVDALRLKLWLR